MEIITITNQKGGVAKTTSVQMIGLGLAEKSKKVLLIDLDHQQNLSLVFHSATPTGKTSYDLMAGLSADEIIEHTIEGIDIIRGDKRLAFSNDNFNNTGKEYILKEALQPVKDRYDYIIIDTPPAIDIRTTNALTAADSVIIPVKADTFSIQGLSLLKEQIDLVSKYTNPNLKIKGILITQYQQRLIVSKQIKDTLQQICDMIQAKIFNTKIRLTISSVEMQTRQINPYTDDKNSLIVKDYKDLIKEIF